MDGHGDDMKDSNLSQRACVKMKTRQHYLRECARRSVDVVAGVRIVKCHASIDVVINIRIVLCHPLEDFPLFWIFTSCPNSHLVVML